MKKSGLDAIVDIALTDESIDNISNRWFSLSPNQKRDYVYLVAPEIKEDTFLTYPAGVIDKDLGNDHTVGSLILGDYFWLKTSLEETLKGEQNVKALPPFSTANEIVVMLLSETDEEVFYDSQKWYKIGWDLEVNVGEEQKNKLSKLFWDMDLVIVDVIAERYYSNKKGGMTISVHEKGTDGTYEEAIQWALKGLPGVIIGHSENSVLNLPLMDAINSVQGYPIIGKPVDQFIGGNFPKGYPIVFKEALSQLYELSQTINPVKISAEQLMAEFRSKLQDDITLWQEDGGAYVVPVRTTQGKHKPNHIAALHLLHAMGYDVKAAMPEKSIQGFNTCYRGKEIARVPLFQYISGKQTKLPEHSAR